MKSIRMMWLVNRFRYSVTVGNSHQENQQVGLCAACNFMRRIQSDRGSVFYMCQRSATDASYPKYPRLPVLQCAGYERSADGPMKS